jgi:hypothetical protein
MGRGSLAMERTRRSHSERSAFRKKEDLVPVREDERVHLDLVVALLFATESLTLIAGTWSVPSFAIFATLSQCWG